MPRGPGASARRAPSRWPGPRATARTLPPGTPAATEPPATATANEFLLGDEQAWRLVPGASGALEPTPVVDYRPGGESVWGIHARNRQQALALDLLLDPEVDLVTLLGPAGTGKTLLTLAAGLTQTLETDRYDEILMTRATVAIREEIGYPPGTEEEKM